MNNDIDMNNWKEYDYIITDSLWMVDKRDNSGAHHAGYHGLFVPDIPRQSILRYTKKGDVVLDAFLGSGTTMIEAKRLGRHCFGIELNKSVALETVKTVDSESNPFNVQTCIYVGDSTERGTYGILRDELYKRGFEGKFDLIILHPPYHNIIQFSEDNKDLSNCMTVEDFIIKMESVFFYSYEHLKKGGFMVLTMGDFYYKGEHIPLSYRLMERAMHRGFKLKSHCVKNITNNRGKTNQQALWRYRALQGGFYIFKHENIFFFWKP